jgi:hypothetical protein
MERHIQKLSSSWISTPRNLAYFAKKTLCIKQVRKVTILILFEIDNAVRPNLRCLGYFFDLNFPRQSRSLQFPSDRLHQRSPLSGEKIPDLNDFTLEHPSLPAKDKRRIAWPFRLFGRTCYVPIERLGSSLTRLRRARAVIYRVLGRFV